MEGLDSCLPELISLAGIMAVRVFCSAYAASRTMLSKCATCSACILPLSESPDEGLSRGHSGEYSSHYRGVTYQLWMSATAVFIGATEDFSLDGGSGLPCLPSVLCYPCFSRSPGSGGGCVAHVFAYVGITFARVCTVYTAQQL
jgi:hypothetical protein